MRQVVHERVQQRQKNYLRSGKGRLVGRPSGEDIYSKYLLSGLAKCGECGGSIIAITRRKGKHERRVYACAYHRNRGSAVCQNSVEVRQEVLDAAVMQALSDCLDEHLRAEAVEQALVKIRSQQAQFPDRRLAVDRELSLIESRIAHLVEAVAQGRGGESVLTTLEAEEQRKKTLNRELQALNGMAQVSRLDGKRLAHDLRLRVGDTKALLSRHVPQARQMLRRLLDDHLVCEPYNEEGQRGYRFAATGSYGALFAIASGGHARTETLPSTKFILT